MAHQDFEKYANQRQMDGSVADNYQNFFRENIDWKNGQLRVLDFGCGDGKYLTFFKQFFKEENIFGVEISKTRVERCKNRGWRNVFLIKSLEKLPFPNDYFDLINFQQVIEHIPGKDIEFYLKEFIRVLQRDGKLIFVTPNYPIKRCYDFLHAFRRRDIKRFFDDPTHISHYNFKKSYHLLEKYFSDVILEPTGGLLYEWFKAKFFSHKIMGVCRKN